MRKISRRYRSLTEYLFSSLLKFSFVALMFVVPVLSHATVVYTNFGPSFAYDTSGGNLVGNDFSGDNLGEADTFTPVSNTTLSTIEIALSCFSRGLCPDPFTVSLNSDGGDSPGAALESFVVTGVSLGLLGNSNAPITLTSVLFPALVSGTQYWLAVTGPDTNTVVWNSNSTSDASDQALSSDGGASWFSPSGQTPGAFEIDDSSVAAPEPGTILLLLTGGALMALNRKFRA